MNLSPEAVRAEVARFWNAFISKSTEMLEEFYAHESTVFGTASTRSEPGRLAATRRRREYFISQSILRANTGIVDVVMLDDRTAIATYAFQFHASKLSNAARHQEEHIAQGRATQVFAVDTDGKIRIFHEHLSLPTN